MHSFIPSNIIGKYTFENEIQFFQWLPIDHLEDVVLGCLLIIPHFTFTIVLGIGYGDWKFK